MRFLIHFRIPLLLCLVAAAVSFGREPALRQDDGDMPQDHDMHRMGRTPRIEKGRTYSAPPKLTGKQMDRVTTLNVPPLGYELDGTVSRT